jgi:hypothetical protein
MFSATPFRLTEEQQQLFDALLKNPKSTIRVMDDEKTIFALRNEDDSLDLAQAYLELPPLWDTHMHLLNYANVKSMVSLHGSKSVEDCIEAGKQGLETFTGDFLLGRGWNQNEFIDQRFPTKVDLNKISKDIPIIFTRTCGHVAIANDATMKLLEGNRHPDIDWTTGTIIEAGLNQLYALIPSPDVATIKVMLLDAIEDLRYHGISEVHTDDFTALSDRDYEKVIRAYTDLDKEGKLKVKVVQQCLLQTKEELEGFLAKGYRMGQGTENFKIGPLKLLLDGSLGARTAYMREDYCDDPGNRGIRIYKDFDLQELVDLANGQGMDVIMHAIGDGAIDQAMDAIEVTQKKYPRANARHGIVHCQITSNDQLDRMARLNLVVYAQPIFIRDDSKILESRVGKEKASTSYNWKGMQNRGIQVLAGSDAPVVEFHVKENMRYKLF